MKTDIENYFQALVTVGWADEWDGDVESPTGHFALVEVPLDDNDFGMMESCVGEDAPAELRDGDSRGWYVVTEDSQGTVWVDYHGFRPRAEEHYRAMEDGYALWLDNDEEM